MAYNMYNVPHHLIRRGVGPTPQVNDEDDATRPTLATSAALGKAAPVRAYKALDENGCKGVKTAYGKSYDSNTFFNLKSKSITVDKGFTSTKFTLVNSSGALVCLRGQAKVVFDGAPLRFTIQDGTEVVLSDNDSFSVIAEETTTFRLIFSENGDVLEERVVSDESAQLELNFEAKEALESKIADLEQQLEATSQLSLDAARQKAREQSVAAAQAQAARQVSINTPRVGFMAGVNPMPGQFPRDDD